MRATEGGFTLLEIVVALAIATVGIAAVAKTTGGAASVMRITEDRMLATWVADNRLAELRLARLWPNPGESEGTVLMGGRTWHYRQTVSTTTDPDLLRVDVQVYDDDAHENFSSALFGYLSLLPEPLSEDDDHPR